MPSRKLVSHKVQTHPALWDFDSLVTHLQSVKQYSEKSKGSHMQRSDEESCDWQRNFLKNSVPQMKAGGFNPNAREAGPGGSLLVQGHTWTANTSTSSVRATQQWCSVSKHKEKRNTYLPGAGFWNWTQDLLPTGQHSPSSHHHSSVLFQNRRTHLHSLALNLWPSGSRLLNKLVDQASPCEDFSDTKFLTKTWSKQQVWIQHSGYRNKWCVNNSRENYFL